MNRCLYCYELIDSESIDFHEKCSKKFFGQKNPPLLPYNENEMWELAEKVVKSQSTVTGVQAKLSLGIEKMKNHEPDRFTIVGLWGDFILKPSSSKFPYLLEIEDTTMHLAETSKISTVPHTLIRLQSGQLAYLTKRVDRVKKQKLHLEDMCQLTERLTEDKYKGSYEQIAKIINKYSSAPLLDVSNFYEVVLFSYLIGNADMHLKNFSLLKNTQKEYHLCPIYDLVASALVMAEDKEELALTLNAKKNKIRVSDFEIAMTKAGIDRKAQENLFNKYQNIKNQWFSLIQKSFLPHEWQENYINLINLKMNMLWG
jgi:serine/threonine-protein kinase HipA